jgi:hypothetical protein
MLFYEDFGMNSYSVDIDEARQQSGKRFITSIFMER